MDDGSEWVPGRQPGGLQRFLGALYLEKAIESHVLINRWRAVKTKFMFKSTNGIKLTITINELPLLPGLLLIDSPHFISLSEYVGNEKPGFSSRFRSLFTNTETKKLKEITGYFDVSGEKNLRATKDRNDDNEIPSLECNPHEIVFMSSFLKESRKEVADQGVHTQEDSYQNQWVPTAS